MRHARIRFPAGALGLLTSGLWAQNTASPTARGPVDLSPAAWPREEFAQLLEKNRSWGQPKPAAAGHAGMVVGTTQVLAVRAGVEALRQGGSAMDAACTTALAQIALHAGAVVSYAGILSLVYYEADSGEVHALMAPFAVPLAETSPLTIPRSGQASGRTALVPGFMKGIESAHARHGKLPFASLFGAAIYFADRGLVVEGALENWLQEKKSVLSRLPATRAVFSNEHGSFVSYGDLLRQRQLAATLRRVAEEGADYMYTGSWARAFVEAVRAEGGRITAEDLARYQVVWSEPLRTTYHGRDLCTVAPPLIGGQMLLESLNLLELANLAQFGHYTESAESCYWLIQCSRMAYLSGNFPGLLLRGLLPEASFDPKRRTSKEHARRIWAQMQQPGFMRRLQGLPEQPEPDRKKSGGHSDGVVAIDSAGNVAAMCHTINTDSWGTTGLFVHGVSIPDSACFQQLRMMIAGPGGYVPNEMSPAVVLAGGKPLLASSAIGSGLHDATVGCLHNVLDFGMDPKQAVETQTLLAPCWEQNAAGRSQFHKQVMVAGRYSDELLQQLQAMGQDIMELEAYQAARYDGAWIGITIDATTGQRTGGAPPGPNGGALAEDG